MYSRIYIDEIVGRKSISKEVIDFLNELQNATYSIQPIQKFYAGVGSRIERLQAFEQEHDCDIQRRVKDLSLQFASDGYIMRSGGATGMDSLFEYGADTLNKPELKQVFHAKHAEKFNKANDGALYEICRAFHPAPQYLENGGYPIKLLSRNLFQVLGMDWEISTNPDNLKKIANNAIMFGVIFTPDGCTHHRERTQDTGGTGQFISYASFIGARITNLRNNVKPKGFEL